MYTFDTESSERVLRCTSSGIWSVAEADRYLAELSIRTIEARKRGPLRLLIDAREHPLQPAPVVQRMHNLERVLIQTLSDRVAFLMASCLYKMYAHKFIDHPQISTFISPSAALTWLLAYDD